jgi:hypothetical protein
VPGNENTQCACNHHSCTCISITELQIFIRVCKPISFCFYPITVYIKIVGTGVSEWDESPGELAFHPRYN